MRFFLNFMAHQPYALSSLLKLIYVNIPGEAGLENRSQKQLPQFKSPRIIILPAFTLSPCQKRVPGELPANSTRAGMDPFSAIAYDADLCVCV